MYTYILYICVCVYRHISRTMQYMLTCTVYCYSFILQWQIKIVLYLDSNSVSDLGCVKSIREFKFYPF